jgi:hypothetical protein
VPAPHRGDANKPIRIQGKAKNQKIQIKESPTPQATSQAKPNAVGNQHKKNQNPNKQPKRRTGKKP